MRPFSAAVPAIAKLAIAVMLSAAVVLGSPAGQAQERTQFRIAWSIYVGWMPWGYAADAGIIDRWADRYGIDLPDACAAYVGRAKARPAYAAAEASNALPADRVAP